MPNWRDPDTLRWVILVAVAVVLVGIYTALRFVQKLTMKFLLFLVLASLGLSLWIQREDLKDCVDTCSCSLYGVDFDPHGGICGITYLGDDLAAAEALSFLLLNDLRSDLELGAVVRIGSMDFFAREWSQQMDETDDFGHSSGPWAENLAWREASGATPEEAAQRLHDLWVDSPDHFVNMTDPGFSDVGIGFWHSGDGWHATQVFA